MIDLEIGSKYNIIYYLFLLIISGIQYNDQLVNSQ